MLWLAMACPKVDSEPWRMDVKEQSVLFEAAEEYWLGVRWGELGRSSQYIEDPLERARFLNSYVLNKKITFKSKSKGFREPIAFLFLYLSSMAVNYFTHKFMFNPK